MTTPDRIPDKDDYILDEKNKLILLWTPKAGCTRAIAMMFNHMGILNEALKYDPWIHNYQYYIFYKKYGRVTKKHLQSNLYYVFKVIRNPYDRAVSIYVHIMKYIFSKEHDWSFLEFLQKLKDTSFFVSHPIGDIYSHSIPQYASNEESYVKKYIKLETSSQDIKEINDTCKTNLNMDNIDDSVMCHHLARETNSKTFPNLAQVKFSLLPEQLPKSYAYFYDSETRALVENLYREDINRYGYLFYDPLPDFSS